MAERDYTTSVPVNWHNEWVTSTGDSYLTADVTASIAITIPESLDVIHCELSNYNATFTPGTATGAGFVNIGGICWDIAYFENRVNLTDPSTDTFDAAWNQLLTACPDLSEKMISGVAVRDSDGERQTRQGTSWSSWDYPISGLGDLSSGFTIVTGFSRYYDWEEGGEELPADQRFAVADRRGSYQLTIGPGEITFPYFPWAVYQSSTWLSCDREGGSLTRWDGSAWVDETNDLVDDESDHVHHYLSGWQKSLIVGEE